MLKLLLGLGLLRLVEPAAFRRLCVETETAGDYKGVKNPAAFRRLCVETEMKEVDFAGMVPAAFRRLCVETMFSRRTCQS